MLRGLALLIAGFLALQAAPARAGFLELANDEVSRDRHCEHTPCRRNNLKFVERFVKGRYLRYKIETDPVVYDYSETKVMVTPPRVGLKQRPGEYDYRNGMWLLVATPKPTTRYDDPVYIPVLKQTLVRPEKHRVYRKKPYSAYYPDKAVVMQRCSMRDLFGYCLD